MRLLADIVITWPRDLWGRREGGRWELSCYLFIKSRPPSPSARCHLVVTTTKSYNHLIRFSLKEVNNSWDILSEIISDRFETPSHHPITPYFPQ